MNSKEEIKDQLEEIKEQLNLEFEPDIDMQEDEWLDLEDQMLAAVAEKLGDEYEVDDYHLEVKMVVSLKKRRHKNG